MLPRVSLVLSGIQWYDYPAWNISRTWLLSLKGECEYMPFFQKRSNLISVSNTKVKGGIRRNGLSHEPAECSPTQPLLLSQFLSNWFMLLKTPPFSSDDGKGNESVTKAIVCIHFCEYCTKVRQCCIKHLGRTTLLRKKRKYTNKIKKLGEELHARSINQ